MATCKTCGETIDVPTGWTVGPAVRRHYWSKHAERMQRTRADRSAERALEHKEIESRKTGKPHDVVGKTGT